jgi:hypothetical protein
MSLSLVWWGGADGERYSGAQCLWRVCRESSIERRGLQMPQNLLPGSGAHSRPTLTGVPLIAVVILSNSGPDLLSWQLTRRCSVYSFTKSVGLTTTKPGSPNLLRSHYQPRHVVGLFVGVWSGHTWRKYKSTQFARGGDFRPWLAPAQVAMLGPWQRLSKQVFHSLRHPQHHA